MKVLTTLGLMLIQLALIAQPEWKQVSNQNLQEIVCLPDGTIWGYAGSKLVKVKGSQVFNFLIKGNEPTSDLIYDGHNHLWFAADDSIRKFNLNSERFEAINYQGVIPSTIYQVITDPLGKPWFRDKNHLYYVDNNQLTPFQQNGNILNPVRIGKSPHGILALVGTKVDTLLTLDQTGVKKQLVLSPDLTAYHGSQQVFVPQMLQIMEETTSGKILFGPTRKGFEYEISIYEKGSWSHHLIDLNMNDKRPDKMLNTQRGGLYISGTVNINSKMGGYLNQLKDGKLTSSNSFSGFGERYIHDIAEGKYDIYLCNKSGVFITSYNQLPEIANQHLSTSDMEFVVGPKGVLFLDNDNGEIDFDGWSASPPQIKKYESDLFYSGNISIGAFDTGGQFFGSGDLFNPNSSDASFHAGPVSSDYSHKRAWVYHMTKGMIDTHKILYSLPGYQVPDKLDQWPAHGDPARGQAECLAPFVDVDGDGLYRPEKGDYPDIRGTQAVYCIFNDDEFPQSDSIAHMGVEIHVMYYFMEDHANPKVRSTLFAHYEVINRSLRDYNQVRIGNFIDFGIGCFQDDFIGSLPSEATFYGYNADNFDESCHGRKGFGSNSPLAAVSCLSDTLYSFLSHGVGYRNVAGAPQNALEMYNYARAIWRDGAQVVHGGNGHPHSGGTIATRFMLPGIYNGLPNWTEYTSSHVKGDRQGVGGIGPYTLNAGDRIAFDWMYYSYVDNLTSTQDKIANLSTHIRDIRSAHQAQSFGWFNSNCSGYTSVEPLHVEESELLVFPNPADQQLNIQIKKEGKYNLRLMDMSGRLVIENDSINGADQLMHMDISSLSPGVYVLAIQGQGLNESKRVVVE
ncbi:T9SS type A sorting domain-containing protein [bacterium SCSIO 12741]|nr:T9SS type A sorting domain-containing protein [bacterium SCSIO 12741]